MYHREEPPTSPPASSRSVASLTHASATDPAPSQHDVPLRALWFGLFGAPAFWSVQLLVNYAATAHACYPKDLPLSVPTFGGTWAVAVAVNGLMLLGAAAAGATAIASWRRARHEMRERHAGLRQDGMGRTHFMAFAGILSSSLFLSAIIMSAIPLFVVPVCSYGA